MTREKNAESVIEKTKSVAVDDKIKFEVWFSMNLGKISGMEPHHFAAIKSFVDHLGCKEKESPEVFESAIFKFGYKKPTV